MSPTTRTALGLLLLRVSLGAAMLLQHGLPKLLAVESKWHSFPDPLGVGHPTSLLMAIVGEVVATALLVAGAWARVAASLSAITMPVAAFIVHAGDPFAKKELALLYGVGFAASALLGPGRFSWDARRGRA